MIFVLGGATYGLARLFRGSVVGLVWLGLGTWGMAVRPHLALIFLGSAGVAWLFRPSGENRLGPAPFVKLAGAVLLLVGLLVVVDQAEDFFDIERLDQGKHRGAARRNRDAEQPRRIRVRERARGRSSTSPWQRAQSCSGPTSGRHRAPASSSPPSRGRCSWRSSSTPATS